MKISSTHKAVACAALMLLWGNGSLGAQTNRKNPTSKIYVVDVTGTAQLNTGETIEDIEAKTVYSAQGTVIETRDDSTNTMVWSNGTGMYFDPLTRLEVGKFVQEPFTPNRNDMEVEPSISATDAYLSRGLIAMCTSKLVAGTNMTYRTPHGIINIKGRKLVIEVTSEETKVSLIEGFVTVRAGRLDAGGHVLKQGQQAIISPAGEIVIQEIPDKEKGPLEDKVTTSCMARKAVYFDVVERKSDLSDSELIAVGTAPTSVPPEITISPAALPQKN